MILIAIINGLLSKVSTWRRSRSFGEKDLIEEEGAEPSPAFAESNHRVLTYRSDLTINSGISNAHASVSFSNYPRAQSGMESECLSTTTLGTQLEECVVDEISEVLIHGTLFFPVISFDANVLR